MTQRHGPDLQTFEVLIEPRLADFPRTDVSRIDELVAEDYRSAEAAVGKIRRLLEHPRELSSSIDKNL